MKSFLEKLATEHCENVEFCNKMDASHVFDNKDALDAKKLFFSHFCRIPNWIQLEYIDAKKGGEWLVQNYGDKIKDCFYIKRYQQRKGLYFDDLYFFLYDDLLVYLNENESEAKFLFRKTDSALVDKVVDGIKKFKKKNYDRKNPEIELLVTCHSGLSTISMDISKPKFSIEENYNDDFLPVHQTIIERLRKKNDKGIVLLHGKPGTGKTSYIRYLISTTKKPVLFLPPNMAASITDPGLMNVLIKRPNSIFVIEDAENIIIDRNQSGSSSVSALLNLADGVLSDCLNIQIICSFNTDLSRVDSALTRKGRLIAKYEFTELNVAKSQALSNKLGFSSIIASPMTLAAVYNQNETEFAATTYRKSIGFKIEV
jgi:hypothetical protein